MSTKGHPASSAATVVSRLRTFGPLLLTMVVIGCGRPESQVSSAYVPPQTLQASGQTWQLDPAGPTDSDNRKIGRFFQAMPDLLNSPEWTGDPQKYSAKDAQKRKRFYWFGGSEQNPTWNGLEFDGAKMRKFEGQGDPGAPSQDTKH